MKNTTLTDQERKIILSFRHRAEPTHLTQMIERLDKELSEALLEKDVIQCNLTSVLEQVRQLGTPMNACVESKPETIAHLVIKVETEGVKEALAELEALASLHEKIARFERTYGVRTRVQCHATHATQPTPQPPIQSL